MQNHDEMTALLDAVLGREGDDVLPEETRFEGDKNGRKDAVSRWLTDGEGGVANPR